MNQNALLTSIQKYDNIPSADFKVSRFSNESYYMKNKQQSSLAIPSFRTLINSRCKTQQTIEYQQDKSSNFSQRKTLNIAEEITERLIPRSDEILEIYDEFEKNYNHVKMFNQMNTQYNYDNKPTELGQNKQQQQQNISQFKSQHFQNLTQCDINYQMRLEINRFRFQYYRIKIKHQESPIQVAFVSNITQQNSLRSYFSLKIEFPTKFNADYQVNSKSIRIYTNNTGYQFFTEEFLYMTLYSHYDFVVTVVVNFGFERKQRVNKQEKALSLFDGYVPRPKKKIQIKQFPTELKLQNLLNPEMLEQIKSHRQIKHQKVLTNGKTINEEKQIEKKSKLFVKDQILQFREFEKLVKLKQQYKNSLQKAWLKCIFTTIFLSHLQYFLACQKRHIKLEARGKLLVWQLKTKSLISVKEFGGTPIERTIFKSSLSLGLLTKFIRNNSRQKAKVLVSQFLQSIILTISIINKHQRWINKIISIQRNYRNMKSKKRYYKEKLWRLVKEDFEDILKELIEIKGISVNFYDFDDRLHIHIDTVVMFQILEEFALKKKKIWQKYIHDTFIVNNPKNRLINLAINFRKPSLFSLPNELEMKEIVEKYACIKKII